MIKNLLVTGGCGFIGSAFIRKILRDTDINIVNLDSLTYAGNPENLIEIEGNHRYHFVKGSIQNPELVENICDYYKIDGIINFAAESHVDRSILDARPFIDTNVGGTLILLQTAMKHKIRRYLQVSTDEVYGSLGESGLFTESSPIQPNSPYSASKAAADHLVSAFVHTYGLNAVITRCSNNYGPFQFPEKLIPLMVLNACEDKKLPIYGDGMNVRDWIYVDDHCSGIWATFLKGKSGEVYNLGGKSEKPNIEIVKTLLKILNKPESLITYVKDRPGHDRRYAIDCSKAESELAWKPAFNFDEGLVSTVNWYLNNPKWCGNVRSGEYMEYYEKQYKI
ncbi:MAG: dTDP-glucose 4,6-dehydratase [Candidatus Kapabacteria bacterium]|nr:dTDP-glucose 4,6-dehydratase [Candidatus Kapabacteria bacterium]